MSSVLSDPASVSPIRSRIFAPSSRHAAQLAGDGPVSGSSSSHAVPARPPRFKLPISSFSSASDAPPAPRTSASRISRSSITSIVAMSPSMPSADSTRTIRAR